MTRIIVSSSRNSRGFTLVEMLVGAAVGFVLLGGVIQVFTSNHTANLLVSGYSGQQENSRVALEVLSREMRLVGHYGGIKPEEISTLGTLSLTATGSCDEAWITNVSLPIRGYEGAASIGAVADLPGGCIADSHYVPNTDLFVMRYASPTEMTPMKSLDASTVYLRTSIATGVTGGEILLGSNIGDTVLGNAKDGVGIYNYEYKTELFYLRPCSALNSGDCTDGIPSLVRLSLSGTGMETQTVAENIEQFQLAYGVDSDGDFVSDTFSKADAVANWLNVISVRFGLVVRSDRIDTAHTDTNTYDLAGGYAYTPDASIQHYARNTRSKVVHLRNMTRGM